MKKVASLLLALGAASAASPVLPAGDDAAVQQLQEQAQYWQRRNRADLAAEAWRKLLLANPRHPQALVQLGLIEAYSNRTASAQELYRRANSLPQRPAGLDKLAAALKIEPVPPTPPAAPRKGAVSQTNAAPELARAERRPVRSARSSLEHYQNLGTTSEGWSEARQGLEELARDHPGDVRYLLALARHLTYREGTRREGIRQLASLAERGGATEGEARRAWRQALVWLNAQGRDRALLNTYLARYPNDEAIAQRLRALDRPAAAYRPADGNDNQAGFRMLEQGQAEAAEARFRAALERNPRDADALGGLGTIRLRQEAFAEAARLLDQAVTMDKRGGARWQRARNSARYWLLIQQINSARDAGRLQEAQDKIDQALKLDPGNPAAQVLQADLYAGRGDTARAEAIYRRLLQAQPNEPGAFAGLTNLLSAAGRSDEALQMLAAQGDAQGMQSASLNRAKAQALLKLAQADEQAGQPAQAAEKLEDAMLLDPSNAWVRLALARQYQAMNDAGSANAMLDNLLEVNPDFPEALYALALLYDAQERAWEGLQTLEKIAPAARTPAMALQQRRLWIKVQALRARQYAAQGNLQQANAVMARAQSVAGQEPSLVAAVAAGWSELGQAGRGLRLVREAVTRSPASDIDIRIQYAGLLLNQRQDAELSALLTDVASRPLSPRQQKDLNQVIAAYTLQQTDALREAGRLAEAYEVVSPALEQSDDPRLVMALARLYNTGGDAAYALQLAESVIEREPDDLDYRLFASGVAIGAKAYDKAVGHAEAALDIAPDHPRALAAAGRAEKARGNVSKALEYFRAAQEMEYEQDAFAGMPGNLALRLVEDAPETAMPGAGQPGRGEPGGLLPIPGTLRSPGRPAAPLQAPAAPAYAPSYVPVPAPRQNQSLPAPGYPAAPARNLAPVSGDAYRNTPAYAPPLLAGGAGAAASAPRTAAAATASGLPPSPLAARTAGQSTVRREPTPAEEIRAIESRYTATVDAGVSVRNRSGDAGTSRLTELETPVEAKIPLDYSGATLTLRVSPVMLDAGSADLANGRGASQFGSAALTPPGTVPYVASSQKAHGVAVSAGVENDNVAADIGATPLGFNVRNAVGGLTLSSRLDEATLKVALSRRAVTDSLLSYAGARDPLSGQAWGGVVKNTARFGAGFDNGSFGLYANAAYAFLTGRNVKSNREYELSLGGYARAYETLDTRLTVGLNLTALGYRDNLSHFTLGHGGYFSPQQYLSFGVPFDLAGRQGKASYQLGGDVGIRRFRQDRAPYFPGDAGLQAAWEERLALTPSSNTYSAYYSGESVTGVGYNLYGAFEYLMAPQVAFGGRMKFDNSRNYAQQTGLLYLRYALDAMPAQPSFPPRPLKPLYLGDAQ